jgi:dTDP-4-dehydrorhamnose reductase
LRILLTGKSGQVGSALTTTLASLGEILAPGRAQLDLASPGSIAAAVRESRPGIIVNAAAYTAVDQAEQEEALALRVNRDGPGILAEEAARIGALLVHFSTDYVFDGEKPAPYVETDTPNPLNAYGRSKLAGETAIQGSGCRHLIFRTSWIYAAAGRNFLLTMLRLAEEGKALRVVDDQHGAPTSNFMIADAIAQAITCALADASIAGIYHMSAAGSTTWYGFARAIFEQKGIVADLAPIASAQYPSPARRPRTSLLDNRKLSERLHIQMPSWQDGLKQVLQALR